jgi:hypothetical protein
MRALGGTTMIAVYGKQGQQRARVRSFAPGWAMLIAGMLASVLAACGGDDENAGSTAPPTGPSNICTQTGAATSTFASTTATAGQTAGATVAGCTGAISSPLWTQTGGPAVALQSAKTQTIGFDAQSAGRYTFRVDFRDPAGTARSESVGIDVIAAPSATRLALRVSQSVRMGGNVSVRAWPTLTAGDAVQSISWQQIEGPAVTLDTRDQYVAFFVAPEVPRDTLIRLRATLATTRGGSASDDVLVLVERHAQAPQSDTQAVWNGDQVSRVYPYRANGPYASALVPCVYDSALRYTGGGANLCPLSQLPFLAQEVGPGPGALPSIEQVMNRLVVSHDWAGANFERFLREGDPNGDFRRMMMSVTAVVVGVQVRPSFYNPLTGAIYLDADNFWLTPEERDTVNEAPDFRAGFGSTLQYTTFWRYVRGNTSIFRFFDSRQRITRTTAELLDEAGWLLYHELGHALDFMPPSAYASLNPATSAWGNIGPRYQGRQLTSDFVTTTYPLTSAAMASLGQVRFFGVTANAQQVAYTPAQVAGFFSADLATDDYAYASQYEDAVMALEEFLMNHRLGLRRDFAVVPTPGPGATGSTIPVTWGQRGRVGELAIRPRLRAVVQQLTPWVNVTEVDRLPAPVQMRAGDSWTGNLVLPGPPPSVVRVDKPLDPLAEMALLAKAERRQGLAAGSAAGVESTGARHVHPGRKPLPAWP